MMDEPREPQAPTGSTSPDLAAGAPPAPPPAPDASEAAGGPSPAAAPPAPTPGVTLDDLRAHTEQLLNGVGNMLRETIAANRPPATEPPGPIDVPDAEIEAAIAEGKPVAPLVTRRAVAIAAREVAEVRKEIAALRQQGTDTLARLVADKVKSHPAYKLYGKEMEAAIASLPDAAKLNPDAVLFTCNAIAGAHYEDMQREQEQRLARARTEAPAPGATTGTPGRIVIAPATLDPREVLGDAAYYAMLDLKETPETMARKLGYPDADTWLKKRLEQTQPKGSA